MTADFIGPTSHFFQSQRLKLHYLDWGNPGAPPLILQHGGRDHAHSWDWLARELRKDWHVIVPDLRGHGDSGWTSDGNYYAATYTYDMAQLISQLGLAPVTFVSHSLGGYVSLQYAGLYPENVRKIVAIEATMAASRSPKPIKETMLEWVNSHRQASHWQTRPYGSVELAIARMRAANPHLSEAQARHLTIHGTNRQEDGSFVWKFDPYVRSHWPQYMTMEQNLALWKNIDCPVLLVHGDESEYSLALKAQTPDTYFQNARLIDIKGAGHWPHHDQFDVFKDHITRFLSD